MPSLISTASNGEPFRNDWPTIVFDQATILPLSIAPLQAMHEERTVIAALKIVLARPDEFHRPVGTDRLGDVRELRGEMRIRRRAAAERAAREHGLDLHLVGRDAEDLGDDPVIHGLHLAAEARERALAVPAQIAVERLHRRMREIRKHIFRLDHLAGALERGFGVAMRSRRPCRASSSARDIPR